MSGDDGDDDDLICPITQEYFRDPVLAEDGRLYERAAITRWINEHRTSPFTRQVLDVNRLQPDESIRKKAKRRRRLSVSYNRESDQVQLPPLRTSHDIHANTVTTNIRYPRERTHRHTCCQNIQCPHIRGRRGNGCSQCCLWNHPNVIACICVICCIVLPIVVVNIIIATSQSRRSFTSRQYTTRPPLCNSFNYST